jgi:hypothetical protein
MWLRNVVKLGKYSLRLAKFENVVYVCAVLRAEIKIHPFDATKPALQVFSGYSAFLSGYHTE